MVRERGFGPAPATPPRKAEGPRKVQKMRVLVDTNELSEEAREEIEANVRQRQADIKAKFKDIKSSPPAEPPGGGKNVVRPAAPGTDQSIGDGKHDPKLDVPTVLDQSGLHGSIADGVRTPGLDEPAIRRGSRGK